MANLIMVAQWTTQGLWGKLIGLFYNSGLNIGWTIVLFTICLKLVLVPLDIYQRHISASTTEKQAQMQPELEKVQKLYASNQEMLNRKTMEIYRAHNFNMGASCLGLLINLVLTLVIFLTLFNSLRTISKTMIKDEYSVLQTTYVTTYTTYLNSNEYTTDYNYYVNYFNTELENKEDFTSETYAEKCVTEKAENLAQTAVYNTYQEIKESWLWIKNIYLTDTSTSPYPSFETYVKNSGENFADGYVTINEQINNPENPTKETDLSKITPIAKADYEKVNAKIIASVQKQWNGYYILVVLSGVITFLSTKVTKLGQQKQVRKMTMPNGEVVEKEVDPMGTMTYLLPVMMIFFTISYTGLFAIYIVTNSLMSIVISYTTYLLRKKIKAKQSQKNSVDIYSSDDYRRYDKVTLIDDNPEKKKTKKD